MKQCSNRFSRGFTLIELLVVIAVLGILAGGILVALNITGITGKASLTKAKKFSAQLESGLAISQVGKWSFSDSTNPTPDTSGYGNNGTWSVSGLTSQPAETCELGFGKCLQFNGTAGYISIPHSSSLALGSNDFAISVWMKSSTAKRQWMVSKYALTNPGWGCGVTDLPVLGNVEFFIRSGAITVERFGEKYITDNKWHHVLCQRRGSTFEIYVDTFPAGTKTNTSVGPVDHNWNLELGREATQDRQYFDGLIDEVQIYNEALTLSQIQHIYASGLINRYLAYK